MGSPRRAMILAAGFGSRLGGLTGLRPKPMLPVLGTPLVRWSVLWLRHHGIREIVVNLHHLGELIEAELGDGDALGVTITYSHEEGQILGTGGGLRQARPLLDDGHGSPVVVVNGKIITDLDLSRLVDDHSASGAEATMVLRRDSDAERWGSIALDRDGRVVSLLGEQLDGTETGEPLMFTGIQIVEPSFFDRIPPAGEQCVIRTAYTELFRESSGLRGYLHDGYWWEHSTPQRYLEGVFNVLRGNVALPFAEHPLSGVDPSAQVDPAAAIVDPVWVGPDARIEGSAQVGPHVQLGTGAVVAAGCRVERSVVWSGVRVARDVDGEIVTS